MSATTGKHLREEAHDRRQGMSAIPLNLREFLSDDQRRVMKQVEGFGWRLAFIRRPLFQNPVVVIENAERSRYSVLEADGTVNEHPDIKIRH